MADRTFLDWPFFDDRHRAYAADLDAWADRTAAVSLHGDHDLRRHSGTPSDWGVPSTRR